jgi:predicted kinase
MINKNFLNTRPCLIIINGRPASGKSTLANWLSTKLCIPVISKDTLRELLYDHIGWKDREWSKFLGQASIELMLYVGELFLAYGMSVIMEMVFNPDIMTNRIIEIRKRTKARSIQILCEAGSEVLYNRFFVRAENGERHPGYADSEVKEELKLYLEKELSLEMNLDSPTLKIKTDDLSKVDFENIYAEILRIFEMTNS